MTEPTAPDGRIEREERLGELRLRVRALEDECLVLRSGLPDPERWRGRASAAYRLQLARLRLEVEHVLSWLRSAGGEL